MTEEDPEIIIDCKRLWDERGFMNISVNWSLSNPSPLLAIQRFSVVPLLIVLNLDSLADYMNTHVTRLTLRCIYIICRANSLYVISQCNTERLYLAYNLFVTWTVTDIFCSIGRTDELYTGLL